MSTNGALAVAVPPELIEAIARRVAEMLADQLPNRPEPYLDVDGAAEYLACPKSRIYDLRASGRLRTFEDGRRLIFRREDLDAVLSRRTA